MTDNEIIKALECCTTKGAKCSDCPAFKKVDRSDCKKYFRGAIDLINSQKADTERHAHWVRKYDQDVFYDCCSNCGYKSWVKDIYCAKCGCKMDEVTNE